MMLSEKYRTSSVTGSEIMTCRRISLTLIDYEFLTSILSPAGLQDHLVGFPKLRKYFHSS